MNYIIATIKPWNIKNYKNIFGKKKNFYLIKDKKGLDYQKIKKINPKYIFFPHWSWIVLDEIWKNFDCVTFHETDLPYGRGGSPIQNLIIRGHKNTKISAIKIDKGIDTGDIYFKKSLSLRDSTQEVFERASKLIFAEMIPYIIKNNPRPRKQKGKSVVFKRRKPEQSKILDEMALDKAYDLIRMLDAESYPKAFLETEKLRLEFSKAKLKKNKLITNVEIYEK